MDQNQRTILEFSSASPSYIPSSLPFYVVGLGASAGGIDALLRLFAALPAEPGMAFVIVLHLSSEHESSLASLIQAKTPMSVVSLTETVAIESNHVYVIAPGHDLVMNDNHLQPLPVRRPQGRHVVIDRFLRALAEVHRARAVGVILSGADSDGAVGMTRIKETGGITIVQSPEDAEYDSMPRRAIETGMVDWVLPVMEMPKKFLELATNAMQITLPSENPPGIPIELATGMPAIDASENVLRDILNRLRKHTRHDFRHYKRATILRRLGRRLQVHSLPDLHAYRDYVEQHPEELQALLQDLLIGVTNFFRDRDAFEVLEHEIVPQIFERAAKAEPIRVWSVGCATGEEAYSLAMLLDERNAMADTARSISVFATDIDERSINTARRGLYPQSIDVDVTPVRLRQHFVKEEPHYRIKKALRETVMFAVHNILHDSAFSKLHLISCRNLLIYLNRDIQQKVFEVLHYALHPGGYLFLGSSESADAVPDLFIPVDKKHRIYQASTAKSSVLHAIPEPIATPRRSHPVQSTMQEIELGKATVVQPSWRLLEEYAMPGVFIDADNEILYATKQAGPFLHFPGGQPSYNILGLIHPDLRLELHAALWQAKQSRQHTATRCLPWQKDGKNTAVRILIRPGKETDPAGDVTLLLFEEEKNIDVLRTDSAGTSDNDTIIRLDEELARTKAQLQTVIEQYEVALEDAKSANEEMQAINEELRSATEELETSKEELQSINEELVTVNSQLKLKVEETSQANDDLQNFVTATDIATIFIDRAINIQRYTKPATRLFNVIATDVGRPLLDITHRLDYPGLIADIEQVFDRLQSVEREVRSKDGQWYIARLLPYRTAQDHIAGLVLTFIDISQRKATEERLLQSEQRLRRIATSTKDYAIVTVDLNGIVTSWNNGAERVFGYTEEEMVGQSANLLFTLEDRARDTFQQELRQAQQEGRAEDDRWHMRKDGALIFCSGITSPLAENGLHGFVKICRDMTGSKWMQDQQAARLEWEKRERVRAEEATRLRDEFFAVLSHELKQPLNLIQLTTDMLIRQPETAILPVVVRSADTIKRMVDSQAKIIDDLMDLSRLHTGKLTLVRTQVNFSEAVSRVINVVMSEAKQKHVIVSFEAAPNDVLVLGDVVRLEQIVWNLLTNALKFTPAGGRIQARLNVEDETVCLEVADSGKGIAPEFAPLIFDMFRQGDSGTTRQYGGMGIGLALVKELVHSHGGRVEAHSQGVGRGAQFRVFLPVLAATGNVSMAQLSSERNLSGKRVLLVDDAVDTLESLGILLEMEGAQINAAASAADAIALVQGASEPFHLIISDIGMPGMDGYALLAELRKLPPTATTPAIALSGFTRPNDVERALNAGFATHVRKPVSIEQLVEQACTISH